MTAPFILDGTEVYTNVTAIVSVTEDYAEKFERNVSIIWPSRSEQEVTASAFVLMVIILAALLGNTAVIYAILTTPKLREHNSNLFIINLSVTDLSSAIVVMCTALFMLVGDYKHINNVWCDFCCAANYILIIVSMLTLAFISIDRYFAVIHPLTYSLKITKERVLTMIAWAWLQGVIFGSAPVIKQWITYDYWEVVCAIAWHDEKPQSVYYVICAFIICFAVPGIVMLLCYQTIIREAKKCKTGPAEASLPKGQRSATKTIRSLLIVVALFFICMTPFCVTKLLKVIFTDPLYVPPYANLVASYMGYMSSVINPLIYGIFRADFRHAYKHLWWRMSCKCFGCHPNPPGPPSSFVTDHTQRIRRSIYSITDGQPSPSGKRLISHTTQKDVVACINPKQSTPNLKSVRRLSLNDNGVNGQCGSPEHIPASNDSTNQNNHSNNDKDQLNANSYVNKCFVTDLSKPIGSSINMAHIDV